MAAVALDNFGDDDSIRAQCESIFATWRSTIADELTQQVKRGLSAEPGVYLVDASAA